MKFVAKTSFHDAPELSLVIPETAPNFEHSQMIPKGHRFEIDPKAKSLGGVTKESDKQLIAKLVMFDLVIVDDGSPESKDAIAKVDGEIQADKASAAAAESKKPMSVADQIALGVSKAIAAMNSGRK